MRKFYVFFAAIFCCMMNVQTITAETVLYESNGIMYVLVQSTYADVTTRSAYVVHPQTNIEEDYVPTAPSSYSGEIVIEQTVSYEGNDFPVKFINDSAFHQSTITSIDLPATITVFNSGAFKDCQTLQTIICRAQTPPSTRIHSIAWDYDNVFGSLDPDQVTVYVPEEVIGDYQYAGGWSEFTHYATIESIQGIESVSDGQSPRTNKVLKDGQLIILREGKTFNALGVELR